MRSGTTMPAKTPIRASNRYHPPSVPKNLSQQHPVEAARASARAAAPAVLDWEDSMKTKQRAQRDVRADCEDVPGERRAKVRRDATFTRQRQD